MGNVLIFLLILVGLLAAFQKVADWFENTRNINIVPASLVDIVAVAIFAFNFGSNEDSETVWICVSVAIVVAVTVMNLIQHGLKNGALASAAELIFSIAVVFVILGMLASINQKKRKKHR